MVWRLVLTDEYSCKRASESEDLAPSENLIQCIRHGLLARRRRPEDVLILPVPVPSAGHGLSCGAWLAGETDQPC